MKRERERRERVRRRGGKGGDSNTLSDENTSLDR